MLWGQRRTKSKGVMATTNKVFVLYSILRETEVGSRPPCTGKEPREKLGNVAQGHTASKCWSWNLGQDRVWIRAETFGKSRISLKRISLGPRESVPNRRRARDSLSIDLVTGSKQVSAKERGAGRSCTASGLPSCYPGAPGTNGELALQDSSHVTPPGPSPLWACDLSLGTSQARDTHTAAIPVGAWRIHAEQKPTAFFSC